MTADLELAHAHFRAATNLLISMADIDDPKARARLLTEARIAYGAGVRRLTRPPAAEHQAIYADLEATERRIRAMLDAEEDDRTTRYLIGPDGRPLDGMNGAFQS